MTADPQSGLLVAQTTAGVARVRDGSGGWRAPSANLVQGADGMLRPEAAVAQIAINPGGPKASPVASISDGQSSVQLSWPTVLPVAAVDGPIATYRDVYSGVDLLVRAGLESVETYLVVKNRQASLNPLVRNWSMPVTITGLSSKALANGAKSLVDSRGLERFVMPPALMWDSKGKPSNLSRAADVIAEGRDTRTAKVATAIASGRLAATPSASFLDDPATVFPVVIDPAVDLSQTHVLRVTDDWSKWDSAVGSQGKVGYNGWTSPYYRSRMFYQFAWRKNTDGSYVKPSQIVKAEFKYKQQHSPQHDCSSDPDGSPGVYAKFANAISSTDTWSDRTGDAWHPWPAKLSRMAAAVGGPHPYRAAAGGLIGGMLGDIAGYELARGLDALPWPAW